ncbi:MAG: hypothetical protein J1F18_03525 [Lachnospiraceae bacterium]|nr:hypothetical protein [Lachnospiraceae bacterium]
MLTISLKQSSDADDITVTVEEEQRILDTINVLETAGLLLSADYHMVQSYRTKQRIPVNSTYREGHIYNGDILMLL